MPLYDKDQNIGQLQDHVTGGEGIIGTLTKIEIAGDKTRMVFSTEPPKPDPKAKIAVDPYEPYENNPNFELLFEGKGWVSGTKMPIRAYRGNY